MDRDRDTQPRRPNWRDRAKSGETPLEASTQATGPAGGAADDVEPTGGAEPTPAAEDPDAREVERRSDADRRVGDEEVERERRSEARRQRDRETRDRRQNAVQRITLGVDYVFYLLYGLLGIRFVLSVMGAAETAGFVVFIRGMTDPFYGPFSGIVARPAINGGILDLPLIIAILAYMLLHLAVRGVLRLVAGERTVP